MDTSFWAITLELFKGFWINFKLFGITLLCALPLGLILSFGSMSKFKPLKYLVKVLVWIIRGTPLMLQIIVVFYGPGLLFGMQVGNDYRFKAALIAFIINYSCYFSEIYRGGIESIPKGQQEAGLVLGMTKSQIFFKVTLLQVVKNIVPPMSNEIITLVKDTSLARTIAIIELFVSVRIILQVRVFSGRSSTQAHFTLYSAEFLLFFSAKLKRNSVILILKEVGLYGIFRG